MARAVGVDGFAAKGGEGAVSELALEHLLDADESRAEPLGQLVHDTDVPRQEAADGLLGLTSLPLADHVEGLEQHEPGGELAGDALAAVLVTPPANGTLAINPDGWFTYTPNPNFDGVDTFTYVANDGQASSNVATVTITVVSTNEPPVADAGEDQTVEQGQPRGWELLWVLRGPDERSAGRARPAWQWPMPASDIAG